MLNTPVSTRILVVEDEPDIADLVARELKREGFLVEVSSSGRDAMAAIHRRPPDLMVLDRMLPGMSGDEICRAVQSDPRTAGMLIIMLTAKAEESDRITGLEMGAVHYMTKPFSPKVLAAQVKALLRLAPQQGTSPGQVTYGPIVVDAERHVVTLHGTSVNLTAKEFLLLQYFLEHPGRVLSRDKLLMNVWGLPYEGGTRTVDVHIRRLREKLPPLSDAIVTVKQFGYKLLEQAPDAAG
jgi:DNA-binding response OmpR family regulator